MLKKLANSIKEAFCWKVELGPGSFRHNVGAAVFHCGFFLLGLELGSFVQLRCHPSCLIGILVTVQLLTFSDMHEGVVWLQFYILFSG